MRRGKATFAALLMGLALLTGCGDDDEPETVTETVTQSETTTDRPPEETLPQDGAPKVALAEAENKAREEASRQLESQGGGFSVPEDEWDVTCTGGQNSGPWDCKLVSGPCNATATVTPQSDGSVLTEARSGCIAE